MGKGRILVVDDEIQIRRALDRALSARGYTVEAVGDGESALAQAEVFNPDLVVVDLNLPGMNGMAVCRELRRRSSVPILVLSVRADESDKVEALDLGADDHLTKPFGIDELLARVRALLRRAGGQGPALSRRFRHRDVEIDLEAHVVRRGGSDVRLTKTEWALLERMAEHPGRLLTHRWLLEQVWGPGYGRGRPQGLRQPAPPQDRARLRAASDHRHRPRCGLPVGAEALRPSRAPCSLSTARCPRLHVGLPDIDAWITLR